jgi:hypothetical protein
MTDHRLASIAILPSGDRLLRGLVTGRIRLSSIARLLGVPLTDRGTLQEWLLQRDLLEDPGYAGPLAARPLAGTADAAAVGSALRQALKAGPLPFRCDALEASHDA